VRVVSEQNQNPSNDEDSELRVKAEGMISEGELYLFGVVSRFSSFLGFLPIEWNSDTSLVVYTSKEYKLWLNYATRAYTAAYFIFAWIRFGPSYMGMGTSFPLYYTIYHAIYLNLHFFMLMFDTVFMWYGREIISFFNQMVGFNRDTGRYTFYQYFQFLFSIHKFQHLLITNYNHSSSGFNLLNQIFIH
jgi:hypothetical protein